MGVKNIFKRYELKFMLTTQQYIQLKELMKKYMLGDEFGKSTICNLYFDTPDYLLIRHSIEKPVYKEKLRLRSYGTPKTDSTVFAELKKKYKSVVYKRRIGMSEQDAMKFLCERKPVEDTQITREIDYFLDFYNNPKPTVYLSYEREAFFSKTDSDFRMTFDRNILWRDYDLSLCKGVYGEPILKKNQVLLEVKTAAAIPMWLTMFLSENHIYKTSFSKYGTAYKTIFERSLKEEKHYA